jgi:hypothetical protein
MFIYNITIKVDWQIHDEWLQWLRNNYIPSIMQTNCFEKYQATRLHETDETEGPTYAIQFYATSKLQCNRYSRLYAASVMQNAFEKWKDQMLSFSSLMEIINE